MIGDHKKTTLPVLPCALARCLLALWVAVPLTACVTETTHSVYSKEVSLDTAVQSHVDAGLEYLRDGDHQNALRHLRSAAELDSRSPIVNNGLALAFQMSGEKELAEKHYKAALRSDGRMTAARNNYAVFLYGEERYPEACRQMRKVIDDTLYAGRADAFVNLGKCELKLGETAAAEENFERAIALNRRHSSALLELTAINVEQGDYVKAQKYYENFGMLDKPSARSLYLGIRLADYFGDADRQASQVMALKNLFPHSEEYNLFRQEYGNDATDGTDR